MSTAFVRDLRKGRKFEEWVLAWTRRKYPSAVLMEGKFKEYDINAGDVTIECKYDRKSRFTKNIAIEFWDRGKPSGIDTTTATHWVICFWEEKWRVAVGKTEVWKALCADQPKRAGGDNGTTEMYLVAKRLLFENKDITIRTAD